MQHRSSVFSSAYLFHRWQEKGIQSALEMGRKELDLDRVDLLMALLDNGTVLLTAVLARAVLGLIDDFAGKLYVVVCELADLSVVDAEDLGLLSSAEGEARDQVHQEEDDAGQGEGVEAACHGICELIAELHPVVVEPAAGDHGYAIQMCNVVGGEESSEDVADEAADGVFGEDIEGIVDAEDELELGGIIGT
jgi:hypothetical protein